MIISSIQLHIENTDSSSSRCRASDVGSALGLTLLLLGLVDRLAGDPPLLQLRRRYQSCGSAHRVQSRLPPVMIVLANDLGVFRDQIKIHLGNPISVSEFYLQYVAHLERYARLGTGYKLIIQRIIIELCAHENLRLGKKGKDHRNEPDEH